MLASLQQVPEALAHRVSALITEPTATPAITHHALSQLLVGVAERVRAECRKVVRSPATACTG